jgi:hypothetical protein
MNYYTQRAETVWEQCGTHGTNKTGGHGMALRHSNQHSDHGGFPMHGWQWNYLSTYMVGNGRNNYLLVSQWQKQLFTIFPVAETTIY